MAGKNGYSFSAVYRPLGCSPVCPGVKRRRGDGQTPVRIRVVRSAIRVRGRIGVAVIRIAIRVGVPVISVAIRVGVITIIRVLIVGVLVRILVFRRLVLVLILVLVCRRGRLIGVISRLLVFRHRRRFRSGRYFLALFGRAADFDSDLYPRFDGQA